MRTSSIFDLRTSIVGLLLTLSPAALLSQRADKFEFTIKNMMRGPEIYGRAPTQIHWTPDGQWIYFEWLPPGSDFRDNVRPYRIRAQVGAKPEPVSPAQADSVGPLIADGEFSKDRSMKVVTYGGDLYLVDMKRSAARHLTQTAAGESNPRFSSDGSKVIYVRDGNAFSVDITNGTTTQLTDIRAAAAAGAVAAAGGGRGGGGGGRGGRGGSEVATAQGRGPALSTQRGRLEADQLELLDAVRDIARADSMRRVENTERPANGPKAINLMANERVTNIAVSPNGSAVLFTTSTAPADARTANVPNYVTSSGYTEDIPNRTKVGDAQNTTRLGYQLLPRGDVKWLKPIADEAINAANGSIVGWNDAGTEALVIGNADNFKTREISAVDAATGTMKIVETLRDTAWVGGPCERGCVGFYDNDRRIYYGSEATGWAQLWSTAADGSDRKALTSGKFEIYDVKLSNDKQSFYFHSSEVSPFDRDLWKMPIAGGARTKLTVGEAAHQVVLSPDEQSMADELSLVNHPPEIYLAKPDAKGVEMTVSPTAEWLSHKWLAPEIIWITASDGVKVPAHIYRPKDMGAKGNGAAVIFVHGAGYLHNVGHFWKDGYPREYMFNQYLASKGYYVLDIDYRASAGYGRDWRTAIYRFMGGRDLQDQVDGSKYLTKEFGIHPERIGMYGGSYGGFMTLMALFTAPKYFGAGAAIRSVTDWAHYNNGYTGQILNLPQNDSIAYQRSSPIFHAEGLEDPLLMLHGMVDTNVNYQDIVRLEERLIELGKQNWWLASYPVENHGFTRPASWTDEYGRIFNLFETTIGPKGSKAKE
ncbi:MAG TPA: prolyl oligopeptidase family serine peptidase [Gemmatimonadaceae bacterium]